MNLAVPVISNCVTDCHWEVHVHSLADTHRCALFPGKSFLFPLFCFRSVSSVNLAAWYRIFCPQIKTFYVNNFDRLADCSVIPLKSIVGCKNNLSFLCFLLHSLEIKTKTVCKWMKWWTVRNGNTFVRCRLPEKKIESMSFLMWNGALLICARELPHPYKLKKRRTSCCKSAKNCTKVSWPK